ncbi:class II aldolase/adducin family protein [uncultured Herbaspirillum sp.]|uniref:class II aldolase/adducin family protein n=1 Tax=uncultured Herbaspirillum sp. TaxID=160236 RepID=UPI00258AFC43|nr:class II aldolase/adducin family protein [uncultured Herbaspirillum sp.]
MSIHDELQQQWQDTRLRLLEKGLLDQEQGALSLRCPGTTAMWLGAAGDDQPLLYPWEQAHGSSQARLHATIYRQRPDVGAICWGAGPFGRSLHQFGGVLPQVFDEQARHLGPMSRPVQQQQGLAAALARGGNALLWQDLPLLLGSTAARMAMNAELFEKCSKAYLLAHASGAAIGELPWLVRYIANGRLRKDRRRAADAFAQGQLPAESRGY